VDQRSKFIVHYLRGELSMSELCRQYEISRKTGYKWRDRFGQGGPPSLIDRSRALQVHPNAISEEITAPDQRAKAASVLGTNQVTRMARNKVPTSELPVASTVGVILKRRLSR
jgi:transposase-like protein